MKEDLERTRIICLNKEWKLVASKWKNSFDHTEICAIPAQLAQATRELYETIFLKPLLWQLTMVKEQFTQQLFYEMKKCYIIWLTNLLMNKMAVIPVIMKTMLATNTVSTTSATSQVTLKNDRSCSTEQDSSTRHKRQFNGCPSNLTTQPLHTSTS